MATTTASITLTSDLLSDAMSVTADTTCMKAGSASDGLDMMDYGYIDIATGDEYDVSFLGYPHRHIFHFKVMIEVYHDDRDIEFIQFKRWMEGLY